ncbi:S1 RNA-binding domain-containing protein [Escherichia coli]
MDSCRSRTTYSLMVVDVSSLDNDYYRFDQVGQRLMGESSGQTYRLGDRVEVRVEAVNMDERKIDFSRSPANAHRATSVKRRARKRKKAIQVKKAASVVRSVKR